MQNPSQRRRFCAAALGLIAMPAGLTRAASPPSRRVSLRAPAPMTRLHGDPQGALLAVSATGELWSFAGRRWRRLGDGLDPAAPLASGHGRTVGRAREGGLWVWDGRRRSVTDADLAPFAGLLNFAFGVIGVARHGGGTAARLVRFDADGAGRWTESARSAEAVLPDARPVQFDPRSTTSDDDGHVAVLAGPDHARYRHAVLGDDVESTAVLYLERHSLTTLARLDVAAPHVLEDIAPRPIAWRNARALLTVRSGPQGAQMAVVAPSASDPQRLEFAALGEPIGTANRWLSPITDGQQRLLAVHTPHIGGVLRRYRADGDRLVAQVLTDGVTNHVIGQRELDLSVWVGASLVLPSQDRRRLRVFNVDATPATESHAIELAAPMVALQPWRRSQEPGVAVLSPDGNVHWAAIPA